MNIREPKFELGQKVVDKYGNVITVIKFNSYHFEENEYWYGVSYDGEVRIKKESFLEPYQEKPKTVWDLKKDDDYFLIFGDGNVSETTWGDCTCDKKFREIGNTFLTREEAEYELERRKIETEMLRLGGRRKFKKGEYEWRLCYSPYNDSLLVDRSMYYNYGQIIYFGSEKEAREVIEIIGRDRLKKYYIGVEE